MSINENSICQKKEIIQLNENNSLIEYTTISIERLKVLEDIEANLPRLIEEAIHINKKEKLKLLHEIDKNNPEAVKIRVQRYTEKHKDEINEKRRLKRESNKKIKEENKINIREVSKLIDLTEGLTLRFE